MSDDFGFETLAERDERPRIPLRLDVTIPDPYIENQSIVVSTPTERLLLMIFSELQEIRQHLGKSGE